MPFILPTAQNIPLALYVHHKIAALVMTIPNGPSIGRTTPNRLVATSGNRQYPSTDAERGNVSVAEKWPPWSPPWGSADCGPASLY